MKNFFNVLRSVRKLGWNINNLFLEIMMKKL